MKSTCFSHDIRLAADGHRLYKQACRRCYDDFNIADAGRPAELRTIRVDKIGILRRRVEDGIRQGLAAACSKKYRLGERFAQLCPGRR